MAWTSGTKTSGTSPLMDFKSTAVLAAASQREFLLTNKIWELAPDETPFLTLLNKLTTLKVGGMEAKYFEHRPSWLDLASTTWASGTASTAVGEQETDWALTSNTGFTAGDIIMVSDADDLTKKFMVRLKSYSSTWTVEMLTVPEFVVAASDPVVLVSHAFGEGSDAPTATYEAVSTLWASIQEFKEAVSFTRELKHTTDVAYGNEPDRMFREKLKLLKKKIDNALLYGTGRYTSVSNDPWGAPNATPLANASSQRVSTTISLDQACVRSNAIFATGSRDISITKSTATYNTLLTAFQTIFEYNSGVELYAFAGRTAMGFLNSLSMNQGLYGLKEGEDAFGIKVRKLETIHGTLNVIPHPGLRGNTLGNTMYVMNPQNIKLLNFIPITLYDHSNATTAAAEEWEYFAAMGLMVNLPETHAVVRFA